MKRLEAVDHQLKGFKDQKKSIKQQIKQQNQIQSLEQNIINASKKNKAIKYHHVKQLENIKTLLRDNVRLEALVPQLRLALQNKHLFNEKAQFYFQNMALWNVQKDGQEHNRIRRSFPTQFMVYDITKKNNQNWISQIVNDQLNKVYQKNLKIREINFHEDISCPIAVELLVKILGLKNLSNELKHDLQIWGEITGDTGNRFPLDFKADQYYNGYQYFVKTIEKVEIALHKNDQSEFDLQGLIAHMIKEGKITDIQEMANQCMMWVLGGSHNPANLCSLVSGIALQNLDQMNKIRQIVQQDPSQLPHLLNSTSNEVLRMFPPAQVIVRFAVQPLIIEEFGSIQHVQPGDAIIFHLQESTRCLRGIENPEEFNVFRKAEHIAFGIGPHRCMGGETGQLMTEILLGNILFQEIVSPDCLKSRDFRNIKIKAFDWNELSSFKVISNFTVTY